MSIHAQISAVEAALAELERAGVDVRRVECGGDQAEPVIICQERGDLGQRFTHCHGCRIVWRAPDLAVPAPRAQQADQGCRVCGCTDLNACTDVDGEPCFWAQPGLCSRCAREAGVDVDVLRPGWEPATHEYGAHTPLPDRPITEVSS